MKQSLSVSLLVVCAAAGVLAAYAIAGGNLPALVTTTGPTTAGVTATTATTVGTTTASTTTTATTTTTKPPPPKTLPEGVTVGGVPVGNLLPADATREIKQYFASPLVLTFGREVFKADPTALGAPKIAQALVRARKAKPFANLALAVTVRAVRVRALTDRLAAKIDGQPVDSRLILRNLRPFLTPEQPGHTLRRSKTIVAIAKELRLNLRSAIRLHTQQTPAKVTRKNFGAIIVIHRGSNHLYLYDGMRQVRIFPVATGQSVYPTPLGAFNIIVKWKNPWWYPPNSPWAVGEKPVPPGPSNPLGTRWMGISSPGVGIHGTNNDASIGYSVSHGCIRMHVSDAEWLFNQVDIGTPVFIVAA